MSAKKDNAVLAEGVLQQLASHTQSLFFLFDPSKKVVHYLSEYASHFLGSALPRIKADSRLLREMVWPDDRTYLYNELAQLETKSCIELDLRLRLPDASVRWFHAKACKINEELQYSGFIAGFLEDITSRKEYEQNLYAIHAQKDIALQILGHDLRAPIGTITSASLLLEQAIDSTDLEKIQPLFQIINTTCQNALSLINEILSSVFWETQHTVKGNVRVDIVQMVNNQLTTFQLLQKNSKKYLLHSTEDTCFLVSDPVRLQLILENLLSNANKFTQAQGIIEVFVSSTPHTVRLAVKDNGIGIPAEYKEVIFQKFTKARRKGMQGEKATGLGLHIVKTLVDQLRGIIWFESQEGLGSTFFVEFPKEGGRLK